MSVRTATAITLAVGSAAVVISATIWSWSTADFWETIPMLPCIAAAGILAGLAFYAWRSRFIPAVAVTAGVSSATFFVTLYAQLRWTS